MPIDSQSFETLAENTLDDLMEQIDESLGDRMEVDLDGGILTIELENGGQYVINKQAPNKEIWVSSPISGAKHFTYNDGLKAWTDTRGEDKLYDFLSSELSQASGQVFALEG